MKEIKNSLEYYRKTELEYVKFLKCGKQIPEHTEARKVEIYF